MANMSEAAKEAKRAYHREWERKNKERREAYRVAYWERKAKEASAAQK